MLQRQGVADMSHGFSGRGRAALLAGILLSLVNGILYSWSVFVLPIEQSTGWTRPQTSLVFTFILAFFGLGMLTGGFIMRRIGPRATAAAGGGMLALGLAGSAYAAAPWQLVLAYGVVAGYGIGMANIVPSAVGLCWYPAKRGLVCGVMAFSLAFGTLVLGSGLAGTLIRATGVADTLLIMAALAFGAAAFASLFLNYPASPASTRAAKASADKDSLTTRQMLGTSRFRRVWLWAFSIQAGGLMIIGHMVPYAVEQGATPTQAGLAMGIYAVANGIGRLFFGMLFDLKGPRVAMLVDVVCMIAGLLLLAALPAMMGYAGLLLAVIVIAVSFGGTIPQFSAFIAKNFGPAHLETNIGMTATVFFLAGFAGPYAGGCIQALTGGYETAVLAAAALGLAGIPAVLGLPAES